MAYASHCTWCPAIHLAALPAAAPAARLGSCIATAAQAARMWNVLPLHAHHTCVGITKCIRLSASLKVQHVTAVLPGNDRLPIQAAGANKAVDNSVETSNTPPHNTPPQSKAGYGGIEALMQVAKTRHPPITVDHQLPLPQTPRRLATSKRSPQPPHLPAAACCCLRCAASARCRSASSHCLARCSSSCCRCLAM